MNILLFFPFGKVSYTKEGKLDHEKKRRRKFAPGTGREQEGHKYNTSLKVSKVEDGSTTASISGVIILFKK